MQELIHKNPSDGELYKILAQARTIAVVGASPDPSKTSNGIMKKLQDWGYKVIPVNPKEKVILGEKCYPALSDIA